MNKLAKLACLLGLMEEHVVSDRTDPIPKDVLILPPGSVVEGELHTNMAVVVAGDVEGSINIRGDAKLIILEGASIRNGLVSADIVEISGSATDVGIDVDRLYVSGTGSIQGASKLRYGKLAKHENAPIDGMLQKRKTLRDGTLHIARPAVDVLLS